MEEKSKVNIKALKESMGGILVESGLVDENGVMISGNGIIITQLGALYTLFDQNTNIKLFGIGEEVKKLRMITLSDTELTTDELKEAKTLLIKETQDNLLNYLKKSQQKNLFKR